MTDSESELDGEISRNSSRSASFDQDSGGSEPDDVDLGPGDLSDDGSHSSRQKQYKENLEEVQQIQDQWPNLLRRLLLL